MNETTNSKLIERVRKLLALATSANENEALAAATKAHSLLAEHNLSLSDVSVSVADEVDEELVLDGELTARDAPWQRYIAVMTAKMYFCKHFYSQVKTPNAKRKTGYIRHDVHAFVGTIANVTVAKMMFSYLVETVARLADKGALNYPINQRSRYKTSFKETCARRLATRIHERIEAASRGELQGESGKNLPALLSTYAAVENRLTAFIADNLEGGLKKVKRKAKLTHIEGAMEGREQGNRIGLDQQLDGTARQRRLK